MPTSIPSYIDNLDQYKNYITQKAKRVSKLFSLTFNKDKIDDLILNRRLTGGQIEAFKHISNLLEEIFPGRWDIYFTLKPQYKTHVNTYGSNHITEFTFFDRFIISAIHPVIHFPSFIIINENGNQAEIKDLFFKINIGLDSYDSSNGNNYRRLLFFEECSGTRTTLSLSQTGAGYIHSHLPGHSDDMSYNNQCRFQTFCTGNGDISSTRMLLNDSTSSRNTNFSHDLFRLYLLQIEPYLQWESLEGGPYRQITNIANKSYLINDISMSVMTDAYNKLERVLRNQLIDRVNVNWKFQDGKYIIIDDEKLEDFMILACGNAYPHILYKDITGRYFRLSNQGGIQTHLLNIANPNWLPFRGEKIFFKVENDVTNTTQSKRYIHPKIKNYVKSKLEYKANLLKVRETGIDKLYSTAYSR